VNVLNTQLEKVGTMSGHQVDKKEKEDEKFDGPWRGRTYGPEKSKIKILYPATSLLSKPVRN
jgi:hypothetical protein